MGGTAVSGQLQGLVAIVTGGASGIGAAIAHRLYEEGAQIAVLDRDVSGADERHAAFTADVSDRASVDAAVAAVGGRFGRLPVPQGFLLLVMPSFGKLAAVLAPEGDLVQEMARIRIEDGRLILDPRDPSESSMGLPQSF